MIENQNTEFKSEYTDDIKRTVISFLNTDGGTIYIGVDDKGRAVGLKNIDDVMQRLSLSIRNSIRPDCTQFFKIDTDVLDGKEIVKVNVVHGTHKPYYLGEKGMKSNGVFVRIGSTTVQADEETIRTMVKDSDKDSFEKEVCMWQNLTFDTAEKYFSEYGIDFSDNKKRTLGLYDSDGFCTNLACLLSDQCDHTIKCAIFEGTTKDVFKDRKEFEGSLFQQIDDVLAYLNVYNKTRSEINGKERTDIRDYPEKAVREAVLNAIVHRDYSYDGSILISLYDDRLEIMSLGGLVKGLNEKLLKEGISECRNKKLADIFYRFKYIEAYGTGIPRIFENYKNTKHTPVLDVFDGAFRITLPNVNYVANANPKSETTSTVETYAKLILEFLDENEYVTKESAADVFGVKPARAYVILEELAKSGVVKVGKMGRSKIYLKII